MVVSPDVGGVVRARGLAKRINAPLAIIDKRRERPGDSEVMNVIGDPRGHTCILVDDIVDPAERWLTRLTPCSNRAPRTSTPISATGSCPAEPWPACRTRG